ncbi:hypothetical protein FANTH_12186 [Fusarium anthophilum]|uniref:Clr5 domain-containing protein n=1 Tax=Fusarium anthophilum TaxID=48485 RepID=A0A8H4YUC1_9HYPO|nr:hypothetical protein FANTH_12186 [Fusarium anthophilum]
MSATASRPCEGTWLEHRDLIRYEYLVKNTSLKELIILLRDQGIETTKGQLEVRLRNWKFSKNIDKETWQYVDRKIRKRTDERKDSDVIYHGRRLKKVKVKKETNRHREMNIMARFRTPPQSPADPYLTICTPPAFELSFEWPSSLPWMQMQTLSWTIPCVDGSPSLSRLIAGLNSTIPEWYPGEHIKSSQDLLDGSTAESFSEQFKVMVYMLSNSMLNDSQPELFTSLTGIGNTDIRTHFRKLRNESPTIRACLEKLFKLEIKKATRLVKPIDEEISLKLITWLLELGQDPNCSTFRDEILVLASPIQQAIRAGNLELVQLLVRFHARAELPKGSPREKAFVNLTLDARCSDAQKLRLLNFLFDHRFLSNDEMLRAAIELGDTALTVNILQRDPDVTSYETAWLHPAQRRIESQFQPYLEHSSALMMAVQNGGPVADLMLDYFLQNGQPEPSILVDAYLAAAFGGQHALMLRLDEIHSPEQMCNAEGITPLHAAVVGGNPTVCKYLLELRGGSSTSLVLVAAILGNFDVVQLLIEHGANPNGLPCALGDDWYEYFNIIDYPGAGGDPNDEDGSDQTALQCALDGSWFDEEEECHFVKRLPTVELLIKAGANLRGGEVVNAIELYERDVVFCLLRNNGTLNDVDKTGKGCLEAEILAQNDPFLQEILESQEFPIDAGPFCAAILENDWDLVGRLFGRSHSPTSCHLLEGTAVGLAALAGELDILNKLLDRFTDSGVLVSAFIPSGLDLWKIKEWSQSYWRTATGAGRIKGSPLALAALDDRTSGFRELLRRGCSMDRVSWSVIAKSERTSEYLEVLREFGTSIGILTHDDMKWDPALCSAIKKGKHDLMRYLVEVGADVNELDVSSSISTSPLQTALLSDQIDMAAYLLENGANVNLPPAFDGGTSALQCAAIRGHIGFAVRLIQLGARVNARGARNCGTSALEGAAQNGRLDMLALLIHHGAVTTGRGRQQLVISVGYAQYQSFDSAAEWLKEECDWTDADQDLLELMNLTDGYPLRKCLRSYCCDEYHDSDTHLEEDGSESSFSSEDEHSDSEGNED